MNSFSNAIDRTARTKSERTNDKLRDEYLDTLMSSPMLGTTRGGGVMQYGFASAADLLGGLTDVDASGESKERVVAAPANLPKPLRTEGSQTNPFELFANMVDMVSKQQKRSVEQVCA
jgi:hypothetical protein